MKTQPSDIIWLTSMRAIHDEWCKWDTQAAVYVITSETNSDALRAKMDAAETQDVGLISFDLCAHGKISVQDALNDLYRSHGLPAGAVGICVTYEGFTTPEMPRNKEEAEWMREHETAPIDRPDRVHIRMTECYLRSGQHYMLIQKNGDERVLHSVDGINYSAVSQAARRLLADNMN